MQGHITLICGPMFSGKSSELLRKMRRYQHAKKSCFLIGYEHDRRYTESDAVSTHDKMLMKAVRTETLSHLKEEAIRYQVVGIDEGQFFQDIVDFCQILANKNVIVIVAALDSTFERKPFGNIHQLFPKCEQVIKLFAVCTECSKEAAFTKRLCDSKEIHLIGGAQIYKPVCRKCFFSEIIAVQNVETFIEEQQSIKQKKMIY